MNENFKKVIGTKNVLKVGKNIMGIKVDNSQQIGKKFLGHISLFVTSTEKEYFAEINLGAEWIFIFSEIIDLYNKIGTIDFYSHQWKFNDYVIRITHKRNENTLFLIKKVNNEESLNFIFEPTNYFEFVNKIIEATQKIKNFKFSLINIENPNRNLSIARIDEKAGTIITTYNGIVFGKPHLSESDKYQIRYSAIHRLLYGRWLTIHTERINISVEGIITTVDEEYILDQSEKNKSTFVALLLLSSLCFKRNIND
ncbi:hypothetical protein ACNSOL_11895 (plasmid) [Aliarcobacter lanthieri]|uniref:hypothetical protein n=1 Tax=Aliarcobacter lanthieri TaxID=1355374 RepID=UPI003AAE081E